MWEPMGLQKCMCNACSFQRAKSLLLNSPHETPCLTYSQEGQGVLEGHTPGLIRFPEEGDKDGEGLVLEKHSRQKHRCALGR